MGNRNYREQRKAVREYLWENIATASMVEKFTGVHHKNITRIKRELEIAGLLAVVKRARCARTGKLACWLTTNPDGFPRLPQQGNLFEQ